MITHINFTSIGVDNQDRALAFYRDVLGLTVDTDAPYGDDWRWIFLTIPGAETKIHFAKRGEYTANGVPALVLVCESVDQEIERLAAAKVTIANPPADAPWAPDTRWAMIKDSEDNLILLQSFPGD